MMSEVIQEIHMHIWQLKNKFVKMYAQMTLISKCEDRSVVVATLAGSLAPLSP